jgi:hypothetical protein
MAEQTQNPVVVLQAKVTKTSTFDGAGLDISGYKTGSIPTQPIITFRVDALTAAKVATFAIEDSADGFSSDIVTLATRSMIGPVPDARFPRTFDIHVWEIPGARWGVASATLRLSLTHLDGSASVSYEGFVQGQA